MLLEGPHDIIPLTSAEKSRLTELEGIVENHLPTFLAIGRALVQIRNERLYREQYPTWELYCQKRFGFSYGHGNELIRCSQVADHLLSTCAGAGSDAPLPPNLSPDTLRPLQRLDAPLQSAVWRLASRVSEHPTHHVVARIVRVVQTAINQDASGNGAAAKTAPAASEKKVFVLSLHRLAESRVPACVIIQGIDENKARTHLRACQGLISRLHEIVHEIRQQFPYL
jgi:hypothetical protein